MPRRIALATYARAPDLGPDDQLLLPALAARGIDASAVVWSDDAANWDPFDAVIVRSCWDYHLRLGEFNAWLDRLASIGMPVWNSPVLLRWNADKQYLRDLDWRGAATVPTFVVPRYAAGDVAHGVVAKGWTRFVIKPAVSASGYETHLLEFPLDAAAVETIDRVTSLGAALVQPYIEEVARDGELSFTFLDGEYSHATLKLAKEGEFRVQSDFGGRSEAVVAPRELIGEAARVMASLPEIPLYARVDGVVRDGSLMLMELELIEPNLFLAHGAGAAERMATAIAGRLAR